MTCAIRGYGHPTSWTTTAIVRPLKQMRRLALMNGWTIEEADNLAAWRGGLNGHQHWTLRQVLEAESFRWAVEHGRMGGPKG